MPSCLCLTRVHVSSPLGSLLDASNLIYYSHSCHVIPFGHLNLKTAWRQVSHTHPHVHTHTRTPTHTHTHPHTHARTHYSIRNKGLMAEHTHSLLITTLLLLATSTIVQGYIITGPIDKGTCTLLYNYIAWMCTL